MSTNLPDPNFIDRDINQITQDWIALYEQNTGKTLQPAQIERILIDVGVYRENLLRIGIQEAAKQNLVNFATYPMLDYLGELVGVYRLPAIAASATIRFTLTEIQTFDVLIPANTQIESKDGKVIFQTLADTLVSAGQQYVDVNSQAATTGIIGNGYLSGEIKNLIAPLAYVDTAENTITSAGGADEESDDAFRERIKEAPEQYSNAGSKGAYRFWAMSAHQDIIDVSIISPTPGVVNVYPLTKYGNPSTQIITLVENILTADEVRPLTDQVVVQSPQEVDFSIQGSVSLYYFADTTNVLNQINSGITEYIASLSSKLGKDIVPSQIIGILNNIYGVYKVDLTTPAFIEVDDSQWANCTGYTINIAGYTNG